MDIHSIEPQGTDDFPPIFGYSCNSEKNYLTACSTFNNPTQMSRMIDDDDDDVCRLVMGTKFDLLHQAQVSMQDIQAFEARYKVPVMRMKNAPPAASAGVVEASGGVGGVQGPVGGSTPGELFGLMNAICEQLWLRDQILAGVIGGTQDLPND